MKFRAIAVIVTALCWSASAHATIFSFDYISVNTVGAQFEVKGQFEAANVFNPVNGSVDPRPSVSILNLSGEVIGPNGGAITALLPNPNQPGSSPVVYLPGSFDNVGYNGNPLLDIYGVAFQAGGYTYRMYSVSSTETVPQFYWLATDNPAGISSPGTAGTLATAVVTAVPEPATWAMMLLGFVGLVAFGRTRQRKSVAMASTPAFASA